uniref:uncharacterized protein n=1 Tax=Semicossyphus pulcher TaxID=241346 RepID=UPI0037E75240
MDTDAREKSRTVVVSGVPNVLPMSRMIDKLTIHFQRRRRSDGGDVEVVRYPTNMDGVAFVAFDKAEDAERVVRKEEQIMTDEEFPADYVLTVFPFTTDVCLYVPRASVDLSVFGSDQAPLIHSLRSAHRSLRFRPLLQQRKATIEGPFTAVRALREDLIRRASRFKPTDSAQTAAVKIRESPLNPRVISHREFAGSVSRSGSKAKLEPANSLSPRKQTTGEASGVLLSNAETQNASLRQKGLAVCNSDRDKLDERSSQNKIQMQTESTTERAKAKPRRVFEEEINAGIRSSLSGRDLRPTEEVSAKEKPRDDDILQRITRADRISASKERKENHLSSHSTDYLRESHHRSSSVTAQHSQTKCKHVSNSSRSAEDTDERPKETCVWVDSHAFRYIKKFDRETLDACVRGLDAAIECNEGSDLIRVILTERQTSKATSRIQQALEDLQTLVESWATTLRVHEIHFDGEEQPEKEEVIQICDDVNFLFDDVIYMWEGSCVKVVGPSASSHLFCKRAKSRISELKYKPRQKFNRS